jgi:hypothetical protein
MIKEKQRSFIFHFSLITDKEKNVDMKHRLLPPNYVEKFDITNDILKELAIKCN